MVIQEFFPGMGTEKQLSVQLGVTQAQIDAVNRCRRSAMKSKNYGVVSECDAELKMLGDAARGLRSALREVSGSAPSTVGPSAKTMSRLEERSSNGDVGPQGGVRACGDVNGSVSDTSS